MRRATAEGLPLLASTSSGGTRMQEGTPAFVRMAEISRALMDHRAAGLPYLVHLRHPTTGGVYASWGSLGHVTVAEPGALVGFLGPKVFEALNGRPFRPGVQVAENLAASGVIDGVVAAEDLPAMVDLALGVLVDPPGPGGLPHRPKRPLGDHPAWDSIEQHPAYGPDRPARPARPRRDRHRPAAGHRRGRARLDGHRGPDPHRRPAVRGRGPGPAAADARPR